MEEKISDVGTELKIYKLKLAELLNKCQSRSSAFLTQLRQLGIELAEAIEESRSQENGIAVIANHVLIIVETQLMLAKRKCEDLFLLIEATKKKIQNCFEPRTLFDICGLEVLKNQNGSMDLSILPVTVQADLKELQSKSKLMCANLKYIVLKFELAIEFKAIVMHIDV